MLQRVPVKPSLRQQDRAPISTYDEAVRHLVTLRINPALSDDAYDVAVALVADIFWRTDNKVRRDVRVACKEIGC